MRRQSLTLLAGIIFILALVGFACAIPAGAQVGNPPSVECASELWNGEYWKIQIDDGTPAEIETNVPDAIDWDVTAGVFSWTNAHTNDVFRWLLKLGGEPSTVFNGLWGPGEGDSAEMPGNLSHVTICFTEATSSTTTTTTTTTPPTTTSSTTTSLVTTTTAPPTTTTAPPTTSTTSTVPPTTSSTTTTSEPPSTTTTETPPSTTTTTVTTTVPPSSTTSTTSTTTTTPGTTTTVTTSTTTPPDTQPPTTTTTDPPPPGGVPAGSGGMAAQTTPWYGWVALALGLALGAYGIRELRR